jgi:UDP-N-acetyl-D-mannosaminuronic acid transferase (WecB/TagA/CpsF family)
MDLNLLKIRNEVGLVTPDGMPLVWMCHRQGKQPASRMYQSFAYRVKQSMSR